ALKGFLKQGLSYPNARARALTACQESFSQGCAELLSSPNNILGIDYIKAVLRSGSGMVPVTVQRIGAGYHDGFPSQPGPEPDLPLSSALAIRQALGQGCPLTGLDGSMPREPLGILGSYMEKAPLLCPDDFSSLLYYRLLTEREQGYETYQDLSLNLSDRIRKSLDGFTGYEAFCDMLKTKDMTYTRISRCLLHILLGIKKEHMELGQSLGHAPYARMLGFRRQAAPLLGAIKR
ncbi:MAG: nucleotidyltransferase family protein, partial [Dysosmobacter sp.]|nr:nucleotidyltransferase family protein [Dysosmobacter sp.]